MAKRSTLLLLVFPCLFACAKPEIHIQDRHGLSYPAVERFATSHPGTTLVLLDYHHDIGTKEPGVTSVNWVGALLRRGLLSGVVWVSGRDLLLPNRNSRMDWLGRSLKSFPPSEAARIQERIILADWSELASMKFSGPLVVSLDLDILCHDPGDPPERFLDELTGWIGDRRPRLVTVALSAAYQKSAETAWAWLERFIDSYQDGGADWYLEAGPYRAIAEGQEEASSWELWRKIPASFARYDCAFWPGAGIWTVAPRSVRGGLIAQGVRAGDENAVAVISRWLDPDRAALEACFPEGRLRSLAAAATDSLEDAWQGRMLDEPPSEKSELGIATRILKGGVDRGCLAFYRAVSDPEAFARYCGQQAANDPRYPPVLAEEADDLSIEVSIFGRWKDMENPLDFVPGEDSVLLLDAGKTTLLQSSLAVERGYDRDAFLSVLSRKAGHGKDGWMEPGLSFKRAQTIWYLRPMRDSPSIREANPRRR